MKPPYPRPASAQPSRITTVVSLLIGIAAWVVLAAPPPAHAQTPPSAPGSVTVILKGNETPDSLRKAIDLLARDGKSVTFQIAPGPATAAKGGAEPDDDIPSRLETMWGHVTEGFVQAGAGMRQVPVLGSDWEREWAMNANGTGGFPASLRMLFAILLPLAAAWAFRLLCASWFAAHSRPRSTSLIDRATAAAVAASHDALTLLAFVFSSLLANRLLFPEADFAALLANRFLRITVLVGFNVILGRFLLAPGMPERRLLPLPRADLHFRLLCIYAVLGQSILFAVGLSTRIASDKTVLPSVLIIAVSIITLYKLWWFWTARHDLTALVVAGAPADRPVGQLRRIFAHLLPWFYLLTTAILWFTTQASTMMIDGIRLGIAAGETQALIVLIPILAIGMTALVRSFRLQHRTEAGPLAGAIGKTLEIGIGGLAWAAGFYVLVRIWIGIVLDMNSVEYSMLLRQAFAIAAVAFMGWMLLVFLRSFFDAYAPPPLATGPANDDAVENESVPSRLATVLPVVRGLALGTVFALTALVVISRLGIDIGPLLAGFGILGLAISFGSQALVRDIVSGFFFMVEDAFRVGEYVDTGKLKGTVEKISLRSMQLRHQSGQIHTIPFGQIPSLTNSSRDWATLKFNIRLDRSVDIEAARKAIKKVGIAMQEDAEVAQHLIAPLKMQGVAEIADSAIVVRLKVTAKPAHASFVQREAMKRVYGALNDAGIAFASNAVTVRNHEDRFAAGAAASQMSAGLAKRAASET